MGDTHGNIAGSIVIFKAPGGTNNWKYINHQSVKHPSKYICNGDTVSYTKSHTGLNYPSQFANLFINGTTGSLAHMRHNNKANFAFLDGHAEALGGGEFAANAKVMFRGDIKTQCFWFESSNPVNRIGSF